MIEEIMIPKERKAILIGKNGIISKAIEKKTKTRLKIGDSIKIDGDPLGVLKAKDIVKAIGRGFSPEHAFYLLDDNYHIVLISLGNETANSLKRIMARVIGRKGFTRRIIEEKTGAFLSIYGKTIAIIGTYSQTEKARVAVELLIEGKPHSYVYSRLG